MTINKPTREPDVVSNGTSVWFMDVEGTESIFLHKLVGIGQEAVLCDAKDKWPVLDDFLSYFNYSIERQTNK
jgi:hypothetical protein